MMIQDKWTGEWYDPKEAEQRLMWDNPEFIEMLIRMQNEVGHGWPTEEVK